MVDNQSIAILENLIPYAKSNAISETSFTFFLEQVLINPQDFLNKIQEEFKSFFQEINLISRSVITIDGKGLDKTEDGIIGFVLTNYENGSKRWIVKLDREGEMQRLSIHCLFYKDWDDYLKTTTYVLNVIVNSGRELFINAYSLGYVDQFDWIDDSFPNLEEIFSKDSDLLPLAILQSKKTWSYSFQINQKSVTESFKKDYIDRIDISIREFKSKLNFLIIHNTLQELDLPQTLKNLFADSTIQEALQFAHGNNKKIIKSIFTPPVLEKMGMNKKKKND